MKTPVNSPFWMNLLEAIEDEVEEIHMTCDLLFPKTAAEVRKMMDHVNYHKMWVPKQVSGKYLFVKFCKIWENFGHLKNLLQV